MNRKVTVKEEMNIVWFDSYTMIDEYMWFPAANYNGLFRVKKGEHKAELVLEFEGYSCIAKRLFIACSAVAQKIVLAPGNSTDIIVYDTDTKKIKRYPVVKCNEKAIGSALFFQMFTYKEKLFLIGSSYPGIIVFDVEKGIQDIIKEPYLGYKKGTYYNQQYYRHAYALRDTSLYLPAVQKNSLMCIDLEDRTYSYIEVLPKGSAAWDCFIDGDEIFVWGLDFTLASYNINTKEKVCHDIGEKLIDKSGAYLEKVKSNLYIYLTRKPLILIWNIKERKLEKAIEYDKEIAESNHVTYADMAGGSPVLSSCIIDNRRSVFCGVNNEFLYLDESQEIHCFRFQMDNESIINKYILYQCGFDEHRICTLLGEDAEETPISIYLKFIRDNTLTGKDNAENLPVGKKIHSTILQSL